MGRAVRQSLALEAVGLREAMAELPYGIETLPAREPWGGAELSGGLRDAVHEEPGRCPVGARN
ncbi:hypothetical protein [Streptomyces sp. NPDC101776]|uniref:hypothetical protein n=1 Tax=Streptomyces sp. NPDC101776 TaxID=3366146 RepID=UPI0037F664B3